MSTTDPAPAGFDGPGQFDGFNGFDGLDEFDGFDEFDGEEEDWEEEFAGPVAWTPARRPSGPLPGPDGPGMVDGLPVVVVGHVSDLLAAGERLRRADLYPLDDLVGHRASRALQERLQQDWAEARQARTWWQKLAQRVVPVPGSLAELVVRWQDGQRLTRRDRDQLAGTVGQDIARQLLPGVRRGWWR